jgi:cytochrome c-type biogenesis protein CcmF
VSDLGYIAILLALIISIYSVVTWVIGDRLRYPELLKSARHGVYAVTGLVTLASAILIYALLTHDFQLAYVASYSSREMPTVYLISAFWGGNAGSLLFWTWMLTIFGLIAVVQNRHTNRALVPYVAAVIMTTIAFFLILMVFISNPFEKLSYTPANGNGLNPLLENPGMIFHPPTLLLGYAGFTVPFAFAIAALWTRRLGDEWVRSIRRWTLFAWAMLGVGNLLGAQWAYVELGWGGYWAWDPVENAGFMPWLVGTAFLHSIMIQRRRGMLKVWNMALIIVAFELSIFGTLLVRSGILSSVHSFAASGLGPFFMGFIGLTTVFSVILLYDRLPRLRGDDELDSWLSRESSFLLNNLILVGIAFATFLGTVSR